MSADVRGPDEPRGDFFKRIWNVVRGRTDPTDPQVPQGIEQLPRPDLQHLFDAIRQEIKREDDLINQRNTWCILATTALVAGIVTVASRASTLSSGLVVAILVGFSLAGLVLSIYCVNAVGAARNQIEYLFRVYNDRDDTFLKHGFFRPFGRQKAHKSGIGYSQMTPRIIACVWIVILLASLVTGYTLGHEPAHRNVHAAR